MGDRVCVDMCCKLVPGEGLLVGNFCRALFLVHSEVRVVAANHVVSRGGATPGSAAQPVDCNALAPEFCCIAIMRFYVSISLRASGHSVLELGCRVR